MKTNIAYLTCIGFSSGGVLRASRLVMLLLVLSLNGLCGPLLAATASGLVPSIQPGARLPSTESDMPEHLVKAAALHKFPGYVEWPGTAFADADAPILVGIVGAPEIADALESMSVERTVAGRALRVMRLLPSAPLPTMHVLFIGRSMREHIPHLLGHVAGQPVLTVTDVPDGLVLGSMINFWTDQRVRFDVSLFAVRKSDLQLSSRLLPIASSVHTEP